LLLARRLKHLDQASLGGGRIGRTPRKQRLAPIAKKFGLVIPLAGAANPCQGIGQGLFRLGNLTVGLLGLRQKNEEMGHKKRCSGGGKGVDTFPNAWDAFRFPSLTGRDQPSNILALAA
jgi:hypothetical protein